MLEKLDRDKQSTLLQTLVNYGEKNYNIATGAIVIKLFTAVSYKFLQKARAFAPGKPFQPSLMFVGKARSLPKSRAPERCFTWVDSCLTHRRYTKLRRLKRDNTLAYYKNF